MLEPRYIVVDTNVWLYYFLGREPECSTIRDLFLSCDEHGVTLIYTPTTYKDVFFLIPRQMRRDAIAEGKDEEVSYLPSAWACIDVMTQVAVAIPQSLVECAMARDLRKSHNDLEGNLLIAAAETSDADYIITYDQRLIRDYAPVCLTPEQMLKFLEKSSA